MTTLNALKALGRAIKSDVKDATAGIVDKIEAAQHERKIVSQFRDLLREQPGLVTKAFAMAHAAEEAKPARAPRKPRTTK